MNVAKVKYLIWRNLSGMDNKIKTNKKLYIGCNSSIIVILDHVIVNYHYIQKKYFCI